MILERTAPSTGNRWHPALLAALLLPLAAAAAAAEPSLSAPERVVQGDAVAVFLSGAAGFSSGVAEIASPVGGVVESAPLFPLRSPLPSAAPQVDPRAPAGAVPAVATDGAPSVATGARSAGDGTPPVAAGASPVAEDAAETAVGRCAALLGVPSDLPPGQYTVGVSATFAEGIVHLSRALVVEEGRFAHEKIPLDAALTELREVPSPEKDAQAREYWKIITTFNLKDQYQVGPLRDPLTKWVVTAPFGEHRVYVYANGSTSADIHYGIDMAAPSGSPIYAAGSGRIAFAGFWLLTGNTVVIEHLPGVYSSYFHLSKMLVRAGQMVREGQQIGEVGETGLATGPHLHWQVTVAGVPVSPDQLVHAPLIDKSSPAATMGSQRP